MRANIKVLNAVGAILLLPYGQELTAAGFKVNAFYEGSPTSGAEVVVDGKVLGTTSEEGIFFIENLDLGSHRGVIRIRGQEISFRFSLENDQQIAVFSTAAQASSQAMSKVSVVNASEVDAIKGVVKGTVHSADTGYPVKGVKIGVLGSDASTVSDSIGNFTLELPHGAYSLELEHAKYRNQRLAGVQVMPGLTAELDLRLEQSLDTADIEEVWVVAKYNPASAVVSMREADTIVNVIDSEQLARFGDSTAAEALLRVAGVSLQEDKYVQVRGMSGRYISTTFNGAQLPSTDVLQRIVPMDIFPASTLDHIDVKKSYSPEQFGEGGAGTVNLVTRGVPDEPFYKVKSSVTYVDGVSGEHVASYEGGDKDWLGYDDGDRDMPGAVSNWLNAPADGEYSGTIEGEPALALSQSFYPAEYEEAMPDISMEFASGRAFDRDTYEFGYVLGARYKNGWSIEEGEEGGFGLAGADAAVTREYEALYERGNNKIDLSTLLVLGLKVGENHEFTANTIYLRNANKTTRIRDEQFRDGDGLMYKVQTNWEEREMFGEQVAGEHLFPTLRDMGVVWQMTWTEASRTVPNMWEYEYQLPIGASPYQPYTLVRIPNDRTMPTVSWQDMDDENFAAGVDFNIPLMVNGRFDVDLTWGGSAFRRQRTASFDSFYLNACAGDNDTDLGEYLSSGGCDWRYFGAAGDTEVESYSSFDVDWDMDAYYLMADFNIGDLVEITTGVRKESSSMIIVETQGNERSKKDFDNTIPAFNATWHITSDLQLRLAYSRTYTVPDFVESTPIDIFDPYTDGTISGNIDLDQTELKNIDARLEWYFSPSESVSLALFKKDLVGAIERVFKDFGGDNTTYDNVDGTNEGVEIEARKEFSLGSEEDHQFFVQANFSWIDSEVEPDESGRFLEGGIRPLVDQPDKLANLQLGYDHLPTDQQVTLLFNYLGEKLTIVSPSVEQGLPHVFEQPILDARLKYRKTLAYNWEFSASVDNLLDKEVELLQGGEVYRRYKPGRKFKLEMSYNF